MPQIRIILSQTSTQSLMAAPGRVIAETGMIEWGDWGNGHTDPVPDEGFALTFDERQALREIHDTPTPLFIRAEKVKAILAKNPKATVGQVATQLPQYGRTQISLDMRALRSIKP